MALKRNRLQLAESRFSKEVKKDDNCYVLHNQAIKSNTNLPTLTDLFSLEYFNGDLWATGAALIWSRWVKPWRYKNEALLCEQPGFIDKISVDIARVTGYILSGQEKV